MKIFWRLILPFILAAVLAVGLTFEVIGRGSGRFHGSFRSFGPPWLRLAVIGGIFVFFFVFGLWNTLTWGKESEEYADLLKEEEADEVKRRSEGVS
jgi:type VI protein secretion system component VasK